MQAEWPWFSDAEPERASGICSEFVQALEQEVAAVKRQSVAAAIPLYHGKRIGDEGTAYQYSFRLESVLSAPSDSPADLMLTDRQTTQATIISVSGLFVTISVPEDLGTLVPEARLRTDLSFLLEKLIERLEERGRRANPGGDRVLDPGRFSGQPCSLDEVLSQLNKDTRDTVRLNRAQRDAVSSALGRDTTFIWGPPGTGKTRTIGTIGSLLHKQERSLLLVSHTNAAVDEALLWIGKTIDVVELERGKVVRVGTPTTKQLLAKENECLRLKTHVERREEDLNRRRTELTEWLKAGKQGEAKLARQIDITEWLGQAEVDIAALDGEVARLEGEEVALREAKEELEQLQQTRVFWMQAEAAAKEAANQMLFAEFAGSRTEELKEAIARQRANVSQLQKNCHDARELQGQIAGMGRLSRLWNRLPSPEEHALVVQESEERLAKGIAELQRLEIEVSQEEATLEDGREAHRRFVSVYEMPPASILEKVRSHKARVRDAKERVDKSGTGVDQRRRRLGPELRHRLEILNQWEKVPGTRLRVYRYRGRMTCGGGGGRGATAGSDRCRRGSVPRLQPRRTR